jgi:ribosomal protein L16/L10AE
MKLMHPKTNKLRRTFYPKQLRIKNYSDNIIFGEYAIKTTQSCTLKLAQLESIKKTLSKIIKKTGKS